MCKISKGISVNSSTWVQHQGLDCHNTSGWAEEWETIYLQHFVTMWLHFHRTIKKSSRRKFIPYLMIMDHFCVIILVIMLFSLSHPWFFRHHGWLPDRHPLWYLHPKPSDASLPFGMPCFDIQKCHNLSHSILQMGYLYPIYQGFNSFSTPCKEKESPFCSLLSA